MPIPTRRSIAGDIERLAVPVSASLEYAKVNSRNLWAAIDRKTTSELLRKSQTRNLVQETNSLRGLKQRCQTTHVFGLKPRCVRLVCTCSQEVHRHLSRGVPNERCFVPGVCLARLRPRGLAPHVRAQPGPGRSARESCAADPQCTVATVVAAGRLGSLSLWRARSRGFLRDTSAVLDHAQRCPGRAPDPPPHRALCKRKSLDVDLSLCLGLIDHVAQHDADPPHHDADPPVGTLRSRVRITAS